MGNRLDLHAIFEDILGSKNVYHDPPESIKMHYPAIKYSRAKIENKHANDKVYKQDIRYEVIAIYRDPESDITLKIASLSKCTHDRHYISDNLHHDTFTLYY